LGEIVDVLELKLVLRAIEQLGAKRDLGLLGEILEPGRVSGENDAQLRVHGCKLGLGKRLVEHERDNSGQLWRRLNGADELDELLAEEREVLKRELVQIAQKALLQRATGLLLVLRRGQPAIFALGQALLLLALLLLILDTALSRPNLEFFLLRRVRLLALQLRRERRSAQLGLLGRRAHHGAHRFELRRGVDTRVLELGQPLALVHQRAARKRHVARRIRVVRRFFF
jgi:hypothetical protein